MKRTNFIKHFIRLIAIFSVTILLWGCDYKVPPPPEPQVPIDSSQSPLVPQYIYKCIAKNAVTRKRFVGRNVKKYHAKKIAQDQCHAGPNSKRCFILHCRLIQRHET